MSQAGLNPNQPLSTYTIVSQSLNLMELCKGEMKANSHMMGVAVYTPYLLGPCAGTPNTEQKKSLHASYLGDRKPPMTSLLGAKKHL